MDERDIREFLGYSRHRIHVTKGGTQDQVEALARQAAEYLLGVSAFGHILNVSNVHIRHVLLNIGQTLIVSL